MSNAQSPKPDPTVVQSQHHSQLLDGLISLIQSHQLLEYQSYAQYIYVVLPCMVWVHLMRPKYLAS